MKKEIRTVCYDEVLQIEAYRLQGIVQPFPNHFHDHYVFGFVESGSRLLSCNQRDYQLEQGNIILFNPGDTHSCVQNDGGTLDYRGLNIPKRVMGQFTKEITGAESLPHFSEAIIRNDELGCYLRPLHQMIMAGSDEFEKDELLFFLLSTLLKHYSQPSPQTVPECREEVARACAYIDAHFTEAVSLEQICSAAGLSKSTLLRAFTKARGITPYRYLETLRINAAKRLLEEGMAPVDVSIQTGFSDQSHFTNFFSKFIGLAPGVYRDIFGHTKKEPPKGVDHE